MEFIFMEIYTDASEKCPFESENDSINYDPDIRITKLDENCYISKICDKKHLHITIIQNNKFEILFELACQAIRDRYYREAIISFASAKEEFYLYYISIIFHSEHKDFQDFKDINCLSERLLGAFSYAYQLKNGKKFLINDENTKLRNKVVHKGYIPKEQDTLSFADDVFKLINLNMDFLKDNFQEICTKYTHKTITERTQKAKEIEEKNKTTKIESIISGTGWQNTILSSITPKTEDSFKALYESKYG
jgi:hypothetical protein